MIMAIVTSITMITIMRMKDYRYDNEMTLKITTTMRVTMTIKN